MIRLRRPAALLAVSALAVGLSACGHKGANNAGSVHHAETEGIYLNLGSLKYQVQISRQLNPNDTEDRILLAGVPADQRKLAPNQLWFGVFLRVQNTGTGTHFAASTAAMQIEDTQHEVFRPIELDNSNVFAYRADKPVGPKGLIPELDTPPSDGPIQGSLVLFKVTNAALDNRPLDLTVEGRDTPRQTGIFRLDV